MDDTCSYFWMRPKQQHMYVQMDGSGTFEWTQIQIEGESPQVLTIQLDECPNNWTMEPFENYTETDMSFVSSTINVKHHQWEKQAILPL